MKNPQGVESQRPSGDSSGQDGQQSIVVAAADYHHDGIEAAAAAAASSSTSSTSTPPISIMLKQHHDDMMVLAVNDDSLATILEYCNLKSALRFSRMTSHLVRQRFGCCNYLLSLQHHQNNKNHNDDDDSLNHRRSSTSSSCALDQVWKKIFLRSGFANDKDDDNGNDTTSKDFWLRKCRQRLQLAATLQSSKQPWLPDRFFRFLPIVPEDELDENNNHNINMMIRPPLPHHFDHDDPPPVDFDCDSFLLTSTATSGEFLLLNPFSSTLSVHKSVLDNAVLSDTEAAAHAAAMAKTWLFGEATNNMPQDDDYEYNNHDDSSPSSYYNQWTRPMQTLLTMDDLFETNLQDYFPFTQQNHSQHQRRRRRNRRINIPHEFELSYIGVEAKPIFSNSSFLGHDNNADGASLTTSSSICGTMVAVGRVLTSNSNDDEDSDDEEEEALECMEITAWFRINDPNNDTAPTTLQQQSSTSHLYGTRHVSRFRGTYLCMDVCPTRRFVYVNPLQGRDNNNNHDHHVMVAPRQQQQGEHLAQQQQQLDAPNVLPHNNNMLPEPPSLLVVGTPNISVHRLQEYHPTTTTATKQDDDCGNNYDYSYFTKPVYEWNCGHAITALRVDATGDFVVVATANAQLQIWKMPPRQQQSSSSFPEQQQQQHESAKTRNQGRRRQLEPACVQKVDILVAVIESWKNSKRLHEENADGNPNGNNDDLIHIPALNPVPVEDILVAHHLSMTNSGFVTLQHSVAHGNTLLLWKLSRQQQRQEQYSWQVHATINLPLMAQRMPKVHYDGRRIIVFGQDHIGLIILVYRVLYSNEDLADGGAFDPSSSSLSVASTGSTRKGCPSKHSNTAAPSHSLFGVELSGGVINFDTTTAAAPSSLSSATMSVQFQRRIRHIALDGIESYDSLYMTCNERFIVVNTKAGNHLLPNYNNNNDMMRMRMPSYQEGLLIIDLLDDNDPDSKNLE